MYLFIRRIPNKAQFFGEWKVGIPMLLYVGLVPFKVMSLPTGPHKHIEILKASANESRGMRIRLGELGLRPIRSCAHESDNHWTSKAISILFPFVGSNIFYFN